MATTNAALLNAANGSVARAVDTAVGALASEKSVSHAIAEKEIKRRAAKIVRSAAQEALDKLDKTCGAYGRAQIKQIALSGIPNVKKDGSEPFLAFLAMGDAE